MRVCVFGLGDTGSALASDLAAAGADVAAFDPAPVATPVGVNRFPHPALAAARSPFILGVTNEQDAELALLQAIEVFVEDAVYADLSGSSPSLKQELASMAASAKVNYADVALMPDGSDRGLTTSSLVCGDGADRYAELVSQYGGQSEVIAGDSGAASRRMLLRSMVLSGMAAVVTEAMRVASAADDLAWLWTNINDEVNEADEGWLRELVDSYKAGSLRQITESEAAKSLGEDLGVSTIMSDATMRDLQSLPSQNNPETL